MRTLDYRFRHETEVDRLLAGHLSCGQENPDPCDGSTGCTSQAHEYGCLVLNDPLVNTHSIRARRL
jgi:hypothetical protein